MNYIKKLSLVDVGLNTYSTNELCKTVEQMKYLVSLDISWNFLLPGQMQNMLEILSKNRRLKDINLAWNNISDSFAKPEDKIRVSNQLGKLIKHSQVIQHIDLTGTGLGAYILKDIGKSMRKAKSLMCIHLSGNPGLTRQNVKQLNDSLKLRNEEDIMRVIRIDRAVKQANKEFKYQHTMLDAINAKINRG